MARRSRARTPPDGGGEAPRSLWHAPVLWVTLGLLVAQTATGYGMSWVGLGVPRVALFELHMWVSRALVVVLIAFLHRHFAGRVDRRAWLYLHGYWVSLFVLRLFAGNTLFILAPFSVLVLWRIFARLRPWIGELSPVHGLTTRILLVVLQLSIATGLGTHLDHFLTGRRLVGVEGVYTLNYYALHQWSGWILPWVLGGHVIASRGAVGTFGSTLRALRLPWVRRLLVVAMGASLVAMVVWNWRNERWGELYPEHFEPVEWSSLEAGAFCSQCHLKEHAQWAVSTHRFSAANELFRAARSRSVETHGPTAGAFCDACHDPLRPARERALATGSGDVPDEEGVTCIACHRVTAFDAFPANGNSQLGMLPTDLAPGTPPAEARALVRRSISADSRAHRRAMDPIEPPWKTCAACHRLQVPATEANGHATGILIEDTVTTWIDGPFDEQTSDCVLCHLPRIQSPGAGEQERFSHPNHTSFGMNQALALYAGGGERAALEERDRAATALLASFPGLTGSQIYAQVSHGSLDPLREGHKAIDLPPFAVAVEVAPAGGGPGGQGGQGAGTAESPTGLRLRVVTTNVRGGHALPAGPPDLNEVWLSVRAVREGADPLPLVGGLDAEGFRDPAAPTLGATWLDAAGEPVHDHDLFRIASVVDVRRIAAGQSRVDDVEIPGVEALAELGVRPGPDGRVRLEVAWNYRRVSAEASLDLLGEVRPFPVARLGAATVEIGAGAGAGPEGEGPERAAPLP